MQQISNYYLYFFLLFITYALGISYCHVWRALHSTEATPSGFGVIMSFILLGVVFYTDMSFAIKISIIIIVAAAIAYWFDDVILLRARIRLLISFVTGVALLFSNMNSIESYSIILLIILSFTFGMINIILTNTVNFYDGADLNLATFITLVFGLILIFAYKESEWLKIAFASIAFIIPFAVMNSRPNTIYLGDSGSFVVACLLTMMAVSFLKDKRSVPTEVVTPVALAALDVFFVLFIRIRAKHDLLTRNYLHLYQQLQRRYAGFGYLLPQIINVILCLLFSKIFLALGFENDSSLLLAMTTVTAPFYFACRYFFLNEKKI